MLALQGHTCAGRSVLPEPVCERLSRPSGSSSCSPDISRARAWQCAGLCGSEGHTQMADRSRKWRAVLDGAPEAAEVMPIARQAVRIRLQPQTVRDDENAYPAFDNRYWYAPEGADDALRTGTRSRAIYILRSCRAHARWSVRFVRIGAEILRQRTGSGWPPSESNGQAQTTLPTRNMVKWRTTQIGDKTSHLAVRTLSPSPGAGGCWPRAQGT